MGLKDYSPIRKTSLAPAADDEVLPSAKQVPLKNAGSGWDTVPRAAMELPNRERP
jgi:hypothetical protein